MRQLFDYIVSMTAVPVFICYRQTDGQAAASLLFDLLNDQQLPAAPTSFDNGERPQLDIYFDQAAPGVGDWMSVHEPYLKRARALLVVCTPGAKLNEGPADWVHKEIDWWLTARTMPPILIDAVGEGERYVPDSISARWPNAQRIRLVEAEWLALSPADRASHDDRLRTQILGALVPSNAQFHRVELELEKRRATRLRRALVLAGLLLLVSAYLTWFADTKRREADEQTRIAEHAATVASTQTELAMRATCNVQLVLMQEVAVRRPADGVAILQDTIRCPTTMQGFVWRLLRNSLAPRQEIQAHDGSVFPSLFPRTGYPWLLAARMGQ